MTTLYDTVPAVGAAGPMWATDVRNVLRKLTGGGALADRPAPGTRGQFYIASWAGTTITRLYYDNGTSWVAPGDAPGVFNPLDYGADPTAATDSRSAVLACIDATVAGIATGLPYGDGVVFGEIQWTAGQYLIDGGDISLPNAVQIKMSGVGGGNGTFAWQRQPIINFSTGGFVLDGSQSSFLTWENLSIIGSNGNALRCDGGSGPGIMRNCTIRSVTTGIAAMQIDNAFWGFFDNTTFHAPDTSTPSVLIRSDGTSGSGNKNEGWLFQWMNCRFQLAGIRWDINGNMASGIVGFGTTLHFCVGENFGANTALLHVRNTHATTGTSIRTISINGSYVDDSPATVDLVKVEAVGSGQMAVDAIHIVNSRHGNSGYHVNFVETGGGAAYCNALFCNESPVINFGTPNGSKVNGVTMIGDRASAAALRYVKGDAAARRYDRADGNSLHGYGVTAPTVFDGINAGTPEGVVTSGIGGTCRDTTNGQLYYKLSGTGNTGWVIIDPALYARLSANVFTGAQDVRPTASGAKTLQLRASTTSPGNIQEWQNSSGTMLARVDSTGIWQSANGSSFIDPSRTQVMWMGTGAVVTETIKQASSQTVSLQEWVNNAGSTVLSRVNKDGFFMTRKTAAPADGDLASSELAIWLDATPGATKVMFKAKDSGGTVRTGEVALS